jgi:hypothetical protein
MRRILRAPFLRALALAVLPGLVLPAAPARAYVINGAWPDGDNIVMDDVLSPANIFSAPAQFQMSEWNQLDTTDNSHPFRINNNPQFSFGADDGDNTIGFLGEAALNSEYGLSYASAVAWATCWHTNNWYEECDVMFDSAPAWHLDPDPDHYFQATAIHELGHVRGLGHYNGYLSVMNSGVDRSIRGEELYMDDREGVRVNASHVPELDIAIYNKYHDGARPRWMTLSPTTARVGEVVNISNLTVENRGTQAFGPVRLGTYLSTNTTISTGDQLLNTGSWPSFGRFTFSTFNWSATMPSVQDCGVRYLGAIIDDTGAHAERFEHNNTVALSNGSAAPQPITILLARDGLESNDSFGTARTISLPFSHGSLSLDSDSDQDYYRFTVGQPGRVVVTVNFTHSLGDVDLDLRSSANAVLATSTSTSNSESITRDVAAGTYYTHVYGFGSGSCNRYGMTVAFTAQTFGDVPLSHGFYPFIEALFDAQITGGCGGGNYCPGASVTRGQMAVFLLRGIAYPGSATPPAATGTVFGDVPLSHPFAAWIERLAALGITSGCGGGNYCPNASVTRGQMAVFLLRAKHGPAYQPPAATGTMFGDVTVGHPFAAWIEQLAREGITGGCGGGNYCPGSAVTRGQMAVFLVRTFNLPLP